MTFLENVFTYVRIWMFGIQIAKNNPVLNLRGKRCKEGGGIYIP